MEYISMTEQADPQIVTLADVIGKPLLSGEMLAHALANNIQFAVLGLDNFYLTDLEESDLNQGRNQTQSPLLITETLLNNGENYMSFGESREYTPFSALVKADKATGGRVGVIEIELNTSDDFSYQPNNILVTQTAEQIATLKADIKENLVNILNLKSLADVTALKQRIGDYKNNGKRPNFLQLNLPNSDFSIVETNSKGEAVMPFRWTTTMKMVISFNTGDPSEIEVDILYILPCTDTLEDITMRVSLILGDLLMAVNP